MLFRPSKIKCKCGNQMSQVAKQCLECRRRKVKISCEECGAEFECAPSRIKKTCSSDCAYRLRARNSANTQSKKTPLKCENCGKTKLVSPAYSTRRFCSTKCSYAFRTGEKSSNWKGGITSEHHKFYSSKEWKEACRRVWARDRRVCQRCGKTHERGEKLHEVHHIGSWVKFTELRTEISNLVLLCYECHKFVHSRKNKLREFILLKN